MLKPSAAGPTFLALSCVGFLASGPAHAGDAAGEAGAAEDSDAIIVNAQKQDFELDSPKALVPVLDRPQTVTVISDQTLRKQNLLTLRDALQTIPGITFGAGEGGGGYGDAITLRGYSASNDITVDGVRDSAQYSRTDPFNLQQIEVFNGANSVYSGSGSVGGTINLVSKVPARDNLTLLNAAAGTDDYWRGTIDSNWRLNDTIAVRLNAMYHKNDVPGRDVEKFRRWGVAPAITIGINSPTSLTLAYVHQHDNNTPIYGVPYFKNEINNGPLAEINDSDYFGIVNFDEQLTTIDRATATFRHDFSDHISMRNQARWQRVAQYSQTSAPQGTFCLAETNRQPITTAAGSTLGQPCTVSIANVYNPQNGVYGTANVTVAPGFFQPNGPRGLVRDQLNTLFYNQTDMHIESGANGGFHNRLVLGGALTWEDYSITTASLPRTASGQAVLLDQISLAEPNTLYSGPLTYTVTAISRSSTTNAAIYAFDNLEFSDMFELNGGLRWENNRATFRPIPLASYPPGTTQPPASELQPQLSNENLFSWRFGAVFKPVHNVSLYIAFANSRTPSSSTVRLGCTSGSGSTFVNFCAVAPEQAKSYEAGVKADLHGVELTAAVFRNERTNFRVPSNDPALPAGVQVLDGHSRVDGIALGATGYITPQWLVFANYTYLDGRVKQSVSDACLAAPSVACLNSNPANYPAGSVAGSIVIPDPQAGDRLVQTPEHSGSIFTSYRFPFGLELGYGLTYQDKFALNQRTLLGRTQFYSDGYVTHRLLVSYEIRQGLTAQINVQNLFDKHYYTAIRNNIGTALTGTINNGIISGGWATPGDRRSAVLSLFYNFGS
jgi:catecholate siderophore receptor